MKTDTVIQQLLAKNNPTKQMPSPMKSFSAWLLSALFCILTALTLTGIRHDMDWLWGNASFLIQFLVASTLAITSAISAIYLSIPGPRQTLWRWFPVITLVLWAAILIHAVGNQNTWHLGDGVACISSILVLGILPGLALFAMVRRGFSLEGRISGFFIALSLAATGAVGTQFLCTDDHPLHTLMWHFVPVMLIGGIGIIFGKKLVTTFSPGTRKQ
jgi:hypothetical protein